MIEYNLPKDYNWELASKRTPILYRALLTQTGTGDPVATVFMNTLKTNLIWTRTGAGVYKATLETGTFNVDGTFILSQPGSSVKNVAAVHAADPTYIDLKTFALASAVPTDIVGQAFIEIQVYNM